MSSTLTNLIDDLASGRLRVVDLTQTLSARTPVIQLPPEFEQTPPFSIEPLSAFDEKGPAWAWSVFRCGEHTGTHFDAPCHWISGRDRDNGSCDTLSPSKFIGPACVVDASREAAADPDFLLDVSHLHAWESSHSRIPAGAWLLMRTDWSRRADPAEFLNMAENGAHTPGFTPAAVEFLAHERNILGVGVETVGTDAGQAHSFDPPFPAHSIMHGAGKLGLASLCNLDQIPAAGAVVIAAPLKIQGGTGSPVRALALVPA